MKTAFWCLVTALSVMFFQGRYPFVHYAPPPAQVVFTVMHVVDNDSAKIEALTT